MLNIDWDMIEKIAVIVGLIWAIITVIGWIRAYIIRKLLKGLEGTWHEYHWTNPDRENPKYKWLDSKLTAKAGFFSFKLVYTIADVEFNGTARYIDKRTGGLNGDILLNVKNKKKSSTPRETMYFRYNIPGRQVGDNNNEIAGIWLSCNFNENITSGASILSRNKLTQNELSDKLKEYFEINNASIVVKNNGSSVPRKFFWEFWK
jgi:hypothetical protein